MAGPSTALLEAARGGDESAYQELIELHRGELHAHCYRMLGSVHDAEDALQEAMLRAWRFLPRFDGRSSLRTWLYKIATNTALDAISRRQKRELPLDLGPPSDPEDGPAMPLVEAVWVEPYPTAAIDDGAASPEARFEHRESLELAFIAAVQHLPATQRAVLVMREVLGFSAKEVADALDTSVPSVNSALQRARKTIEERVPERSQQETLRTLGDDEVREIVESYMRAWEQGDVDTVVSLLSEDACFSMPPMSLWFGPRDEIEVFLRLSPMGGEWRWKAIPTRANGQPALAFYAWHDGEGAYLPFALNVLTFDGDKISDVTAFIARIADSGAKEEMLRMPEQPFDEERMAAAFGRFGMPGRLTD